MLIVQMDAEKGSDKICENLREGKSIPADHAANSRKEICENLRERKSIPADHADGRRNAIQMILKLYFWQILWGKLSFRFSNAKSVLNIIRFCFFLSDERITSNFSMIAISPVMFVCYSRVDFVLAVLVPRAIFCSIFKPAKPLP